MAAFECGRDALRLRVLLADIGLPQAGPTTIFEGNEICIRMSETKSSTPRMQYLDARYRAITGSAKLWYTPRPSGWCTARPQRWWPTPLTKPLGSYEVRRFHGGLSGTAPSIPHPPFESFAGEYGGA
jgi:hypothetical protein